MQKISTGVRRQAHLDLAARKAMRDAVEVSRDLDVVVDRSGRVLDYRVVRSTGHPDLDAAVEDMMRGASLPAFPASMPQPQVEVWVAICFVRR